jgi:hypothetical protein
MSAVALEASLGCCKILDEMSKPSEDLDARWTFTWEHEQKRYTDVWYDRSDECIGTDEPKNVKSLTEKSRSVVCRKKICGKSSSPSCSFDCDAKIKMVERRCDDVPAGTTVREDAGP